MPCSPGLAWRASYTRHIVESVPIPAICRNCGAVFPSPIRLEPGVVNVRIAAPFRTTCPVCLADAYVVEGIFDFVADTLRIVTTWSPERTQRLVDAIEAAREQANPREAVEQVIGQEPELRSLAQRYLIPRDPGQFWAFVAALLAAFGLLTGSAGESATINQQTVIERLCAAGPTPTMPSKRPPPPAPRKRAKRDKRS